MLLSFLVAREKKQGQWILYRQLLYSGTSILRYAKGAAELDRYIEVSLYRDSRYNDTAVK